MGTLLLFLGVSLIVLSVLGPGGVLTLIAGAVLLWAGILL